MNSLQTTDHQHCGACGGPLQLLGQLGMLVHLICRNCGLQTAYRVDSGARRIYDNHSHGRS